LHGGLVLLEDLVRPVERLGQSLCISASEISQHASLAAFEERAALDRIVEGYAENHRFCSKGCRNWAWPAFCPATAPSISAWTSTT